MQSALLMTPMAVVTVALSPLFGRQLTRWSPRMVATGGVACFVVGLGWMAWLIGHDATWPALVAPSALVVLANASMWSSLSLSATAGLDPARAGAGSGVYDATRQIGSVLGSAAMAAVISARLSATMPAPAGGAAGSHAGGAAGSAATAQVGALGQLAQALHAPFAAAMGQSVLLPALVLLVALPAFLALPRTIGHSRKPR